MKKKNTTSVELSKALIDELGGISAVARWAEITRQSVFSWKKNGIPTPFLKLMRLEFPNLKSWLKE